MSDIEAQDVCFSYGRNAVLQGATFAIERGEFVGILGPNGSGKTTILKLVSGVLRAESGLIKLKDRNIRDYSPREIARHVAVVPQDTAIAFPFSALEIVLMGRSPYLPAFAFDRQADLDIAHEVMRETDTAHLAGRRIHELSGGERQRVIVARALAQQPEILLLDEPVTFLDIRHQIAIHEVLRELNSRGLTVVMISHDLNLASQYCSRLILLSNGRVHATGEPKEIISSETVREVYEADVMVHHRPDNGLPYVLPLSPDKEAEAR